MPLAISDILRICDDYLADDLAVTLRHDMTEWTARDVERYFESGGRREPSSPNESDEEQEQCPLPSNTTLPADDYTAVGLDASDIAEGSGVGLPSNTTLPADDYTAVGLDASDIAEGSGVGVDLDGRSLAIFAIKGRYYAVDRACPHQGRPLELSDIEDTGAGPPCIYCPYHGWCFELTSGWCEDMQDYGIRTYDVQRLADGGLCVAVNPQHQQPQRAEPSVASTRNIHPPLADLAHPCTLPPSNEELD